MSITSTIAEQAASHNRASAGQLPLEVAEALASEQPDLAAADNPSGVAEPGSRRPDGELLDVDGQPTTLAQNLGGKPVVIVFYRGVWCPSATSPCAPTRRSSCPRWPSAASAWLPSARRRQTDPRPRKSRRS